MNSSQNKGLSPSCIALSFDGLWLNFMAQYLLGFFFPALIQFLHFFFGFPTFSAWRDLSSQIAHLVHQNWYRISFTFKMTRSLTCSLHGLYSRCLDVSVSGFTLSPIWSRIPSCKHITINLLFLAVPNTSAGVWRALYSPFFCLWDWSSFLWFTSIQIYWQRLQIMLMAFNLISTAIS
jgi:hypothetical protein